MRSVSGRGDTVLPWQVIREDGHGNRYRVGSYATRTEARQVADRLGGSGGRANGDDEGDGSYLVEPLGCASGEYA
jgi:hypothetical protein